MHSCSSQKSTSILWCRKPSTPNIRCSCRSPVKVKVVVICHSQRGYQKNTDKNTGPQFSKTKGVRDISFFSFDSKLEIFLSSHWHTLVFRFAFQPPAFSRIEYYAYRMQCQSLRRHLLCCSSLAIRKMTYCDFANFLIIRCHQWLVNITLVMVVSEQT